MQRKTYAVIDSDILEKNVKEIKNKYPDYKYYFGVVKNNCYHHGMKSIVSLIQAGINYLAVSSLEEAIQARHYTTEIPILCLEVIDLEFIDDVINYDITLTVESLEYFKKLCERDLYSALKIHLKLDSGMHRLGFLDKEEIKEVVDKINSSSKMILEGIYSHFATSGITDAYWDKQVENFLEITSLIDLEKIPIVHFGRSLTLVNHPKLSFCNGIRLGIVLFGFSQNRITGKGIKNKLRVLKRKCLQKKNKCSETTLENNLQLQEAFSLYSTVMSSRKVIENDRVGYNTYKIKEEGYILTIPIGYADGVTKEYGFVYIDENPYPIVSDCMDMIMVFSEKEISVGTLVEIIGPHQRIKDLCKRLSTNSYHLLNLISNRVTRVHKKEKEQEEIIY